MVMEYVKHDKDLAGDVSLRLRTGNIEFQFPPRILSDNRRGTWQEGELRGVEPIAVFATSGPREMTLSWTYIVDGDLWNVDRIQTNVRQIRGYFAQIRNMSSDSEALVVSFKMWKLGDNAKRATCRIISIDVKHGDTLVGDALDGYPLRTDITVDLKIWTQGMAAFTDIDAKDVGKAVEAIRTATLDKSPGVDPVENVLWY